MKITKKHTITKQEDVVIIPFLEFLYKDIKNITVSGIPEDKIKTPDYYIETTNTLIEVKEIHDRESNQKHALWAKIVTRLQKAVDQNELLTEVKGTFLVNTPERFKSPTNQSSFDSAAGQVLRAVIDNQKIVNIFNVPFEINKVSNQESVVVFGSNGGGGFIDPAGVVYQNIKDKLVSANNQLGSSALGTQPTNKIVLLVNKYYFPLWNWDLFKAIARTYKDLLTYKNIDEIWYQFETKEQGFIHKLLYRRNFFEQFEKGKFEELNEDDYLLFANWFSALSELGDDEKEKIFIALKYFLTDKKPGQIFTDRQTREDIVRFGLWLAEKERFDDVIWFIERFIDDPDPSDPDKFEGDEQFNYHQQILNNEDTNTITTVLGHLAWVIQKIAVRKNYIAKSLEFTQKLLSHKNLYVKSQALIPLIEISARRQWLEDSDKEKGTKLYEVFHATVFDLLDHYSQYKGIANWLTHVFYYYKDLTTEEAIKVLDKLANARESASLFVYFGIFRQRHYKGKVEFDQNPLKEKLEKTILTEEEENRDLKGSIAWNFWRILEDSPEEFDTLKPYLDLYFTLPYGKKYYSSLERIIEEWVERKPDICINWFISTISKIRETVERNKDEGRNTWLDSDKTIMYVANNRPELLLPLVGNLVQLWKDGAYIGGPKMVFDTYKVVNDSKLKNKIKTQYESWYEEMKKLNPKTEIVDWDN